MECYLLEVTWNVARFDLIVPPYSVLCWLLLKVSTHTHKANTQRSSLITVILQLINLSWQNKAYSNV